MGRPEECCELAKQGLTPCEIASQLGISTGSVNPYLDTAVRKHLISRSDILFNLIERVNQLSRQLTEEDLPAEIATNELLESLDKRFPAYGADFRLLASLDEYRIFSTDLYQLVLALERNLHKQIPIVLRGQFRGDAHAWWCQGVPSKVRSDCEGRQRRDANLDDPWTYTTFAHLEQVLESNWPTFCDHLPQDVVDDKEHFFECLDKLRGIRNRVMHPVGDSLPTEADFRFVDHWLQKLKPDQWR